MEGAPKIPSKEVKKAAKAVAVGLSAGMAAMTPIHKVTEMPADNAPVTAEKQVVRKEDMNVKVLKDEIEANRATFEINKEGQIQRVESKDK